MTGETKNWMQGPGCKLQAAGSEMNPSRIARRPPHVAVPLLLLAVCFLFFNSPSAIASSPVGQGSVSRGPIVNPRDPELEKNASHNLEVAHFYIKKKKWAAAEGRLQEIVRDHPEYSQMAEVYYLLGDVYRQTKRRELAVELYSRVVEEFPKSEFADRARARLKEMGAQPTKGSSRKVPPTA